MILVGEVGEGTQKQSVVLPAAGVALRGHQFVADVREGGRAAPGDASHIDLGDEIDIILTKLAVIPVAIGVPVPGEIGVIVVCGGGAGMAIRIAISHGNDVDIARQQHVLDAPIDVFVDEKVADLLHQIPAGVAAGDPACGHHIDCVADILLPVHQVRDGALQAGRGDDHVIVGGLGRRGSRSRGVPGPGLIVVVQQLCRPVLAHPVGQGSLHPSVLLAPRGNQPVVHLYGGPGREGDLPGYRPVGEGIEGDSQKSVFAQPANAQIFSCLFWEQDIGEVYGVVAGLPVPLALLYCLLIIALANDARSRLDAVGTLLDGSTISGDVHPGHLSSRGQGEVVLSDGQHGFSGDLQLVEAGHLDPLKALIGLGDLVRAGGHGES